MAAEIAPVTESQKAQIEEILPLSPLDTQEMQVLADHGGEATIYLAPQHYHPAAHPEVPASSVVIKVVKETPADSQDQGVSLLCTAFNWSRVAPPLRTNLASLKAILSLSQILHPDRTHHLNLTLETLQNHYAVEDVNVPQENLADWINSLVQSKEIKIHGRSVRINQIFPRIYEFGLTQDFRWFISMQKVDQILIDTFPKFGPLKLARFNTYAEAESALRIPELAAQLAVIWESGFIVGDLKPEDLGLVNNRLVILDPQLLPQGVIMTRYTPTMLSPDIQARLKEPGFRPRATPDIDKYAVQKMLEQAVSIGLGI